MSITSEAHHVNGKPYLTLATQNNQNCYWKIVPHGNSLFSIVYKKGCDENDQSGYCGSILSFDVIDGRAFANMKATNGNMWQIADSEWKG